MSRHQCSGCGLDCDGRCYDETPEPRDEPTESDLTLKQLRELYGSPLTDIEVRPLGNGKWRAAA